VRLYLDSQDLGWKSAFSSAKLPANWHYNARTAKERFWLTSSLPTPMCNARSAREPALTGLPAAFQGLQN
jgi:hypothetical protein